MFYIFLFYLGIEFLEILFLSIIFQIKHNEYLRYLKNIFNF